MSSELLVLILQEYHLVLLHLRSSLHVSFENIIGVPLHAGEAEVHATGEGSSEESNCKVALISVHRESNKLHNWLADNDRVFFSLGPYLSGWWTPLTSEQVRCNILGYLLDEQLR